MYFVSVRFVSIKKVEKIGVGTIVGLSVWLLCASQARDHQAVTLLRCSTPWALLTMITKLMMMAMDMMEL